MLHKQNNTFFILEALLVKAIRITTVHPENCTQLKKHNYINDIKKI